MASFVMTRDLLCYGYRWRWWRWCRSMHRSNFWSECIRISFNCRKDSCTSFVLMIGIIQTIFAVASTFRTILAVFKTRTIQFKTQILLTIASRFHRAQSDLSLTSFWLIRGEPSTLHRRSRLAKWSLWRCRAILVAQSYLSLTSFWLIRGELSILRKQTGRMIVETLEGGSLSRWQLKWFEFWKKDITTLFTGIPAPTYKKKNRAAVFLLVLLFLRRYHLNESRFIAGITHSELSR